MYKDHVEVEDWTELDWTKRPGAKPGHAMLPDMDTN